MGTVFDGIKGVTLGLVRGPVTRDQVRNLARDTDLEDSEDLADVVRESPRSLANATEECLADIERLPERMLARYRRARGGRRRK